MLADRTQSDVFGRFRTFSDITLKKACRNEIFFVTLPTTNQMLSLDIDSQADVVAWPSGSSGGLMSHREVGLRAATRELSE